MLDHMILTVSDVTRSLAFYEAALKPLQIRFFMPYKGEDGHPDLWGFNVGAQPTSFAWTRGRDGWDDRPTHPGHCRILTHGESHPSRWLQTYNEISLITRPQFVSDVVRHGLATDRIEFASRHSVVDPVIADFATTFCAELTADTPNGVMYAETLTVGLVLHLLANDGIGKTEGTIAAWQVECISASRCPRVHRIAACRRCVAADSCTAGPHQSFPFRASLPRHRQCASASICVTASP